MEDSHGDTDPHPCVRSVPVESDRWCLGPRSKHPMLISRGIIFEEFQPMWSRYLNVTDGQTDELVWHNRAMRSIAREKYKLLLISTLHVW